MAEGRERGGGSQWACVGAGTGKLESRQAGQAMPAHRRRHQGIICREKGVQLANAHGHMACGSVLAQEVLALQQQQVLLGAAEAADTSLHLFYFFLRLRHVMKRESNSKSLLLLHGVIDLLRSSDSNSSCSSGSGSGSDSVSGCSN